MRLREIDIERITQTVKENIFKPVNQYKTTVFICGGAIDSTKSLRYQVAKNFEEHSWVHWDELVYPEILFEQILYRKDTADIQNLETMLAESVDVILICPESPGSFTELGAFTHDERLKNKIVCIQKLIYKKSKSYINTGPIKILKNSETSKVIYIDDIVSSDDGDDIRRAINKIKKIVPATKEVINLLELENFVLPCIYLFDPISDINLISIVSHAMQSEKFGQSGTIACLNKLASENLITSDQTGIRLSDTGLLQFRRFMKSNKKIAKGMEFADNLRLEIMNAKYRNKEIVWT